jgi:hypothetical protein
MWALFTYSCPDFCGDHLASSLELLFIEQMVAALHQLTNRSMFASIHDSLTYQSGCTAAASCSVAWSFVLSAFL